jgi:hypothetical protein
MDACGRVVLLVGRSRFTSHFALVAHQTRTRTCRRGHVLHVCRYNVGGFAMCMKTGRWLSLDGMARLYCTVLWRWSCNAYVTLRGARRGHASYPDASLYFPRGAHTVYCTRGGCTGALCLADARRAWMTPWCRWGAPPVGADVPVERSSMASAYLGGAACVEPAGEGRGLHRSGLWTGVLVRDGGRVVRFVEGWAGLGGRRRCIHCLGMQCDGGGQASQVTPLYRGGGGEMRAWEIRWCVFTWLSIGGICGWGIWYLCWKRRGEYQECGICSLERMTTDYTGTASRDSAPYSSTAT